MRRVIRTKVAAPGLSTRHVPRPGLCSLLSAGTHSVTLVSAPPGSGKTMLLAEWVVRDLQGRAAWLSLDEADNDPVRFWLYLITAVQSQDRRLGIDALDHLSGPGWFDPTDVVDSLIADCEELSEPLPLILDDVHNLTARPVLEQLDLLVTRLPAGVRLVLSTRNDPLLRLNRLRGGQLLELRERELRFSESEARSLLELDFPKLDQNDLRRLVERTEGWVMALQMLALSWRGKRDLHRHPLQGAMFEPVLGDYLMTEVLNGLPRQIRNFLLMTSVLEELDPNLCDAVSQRQDSQQILRYLQRHNVFVVPSTAADAHPRYHHLFAEFLRLELHAEAQDTERAAHLRAAAWWRAAGRWERTIDHLLAAGADTEAFEVLIEAIVDGYDDRLASVVAGMFERFPQRRSDEYVGRLLDVASVMVAAGHYPEAAAQLDRFERETSTGVGADPVQEARYPAIRAVLAYFEGDPNRTIEWSHRAIALYQLKADAGYHCRLPTAIVRSLGWLGEIDAALAASTRSYALPPPPEGLVRALPACALSQIHLIQGALREAEALVHVAFPDEAEPHPPGLIEAHLTLGGLAWERNQLAAAERQFALALGEAQEHHWVPFAVTASLGLALVWHVTERRQEAFELIANTRHINFPRPLSEPFTARIEQTLARLLLGEGNFSASRRVLAALPQSVDSRLLQARLAVEEKRLSEAAALLRGLRRERLTPRQWLQLALLDARSGSPTAARSLCAGLEIAEPEWFLRPFIEVGVDPASFENGAIRPDGRPFLRAVTEASVPPRQSLSAEQIPGPQQLSDRELIVLQHLPAWRSNGEIAADLYVSVNTVKAHLKSIYRKLDVTSRSSAVAKARAVGLL